jgi:serine/threonine-protein kinase HipA
MPYRAASYIWKNKLHPIFDMNIPEGYLFEILKQYIAKEHGTVNDFLTFSYLCGNIQSRLSYKSWIKQSEFESFDIQEIIDNDSNDTFSKLVNTYLTKNAISGVQPKSLALLKDKESLSIKEYIIKTWGEEYEELALNEHFCLQTIKRTGIPTANTLLSKNNKFLIVERFNNDKSNNEFLGFEEILCLLGKNKEEKYSGSYEKVASLIYNVTTNKKESMENFYKLIVMNYLLKNGDAHLKNFGILYNNDFTNVFFAPAYDVVNTCIYFYKDHPALSMHGKKLWFGKKELVKFGVQSCYLSKAKASAFYDECIKSLKITIDEVKIYTQMNQNFQKIGTRLYECWKLSLNETTHKELPNELIRTWN